MISLLERNYTIGTYSKMIYMFDYIDCFCRFLIFRTFFSIVCYTNDIYIYINTLICSKKNIYIYTLIRSDKKYPSRKLVISQ